MELNIGWPEGILIGLHLMGSAANIARKERGEDRIIEVVASLIYAAIMYPLLYWGGFFS